DSSRIEDPVRHDPRPSAVDRVSARRTRRRGSTSDGHSTIGRLVRRGRALRAMTTATGRPVAKPGLCSKFLRPCSYPPPCCNTSAHSDHTVRTRGESPAEPVSFAPMSYRYSQWRTECGRKPTSSKVNTKDDCSEWMVDTGSGLVSRRRNGQVGHATGRFPQ